MKSEEKPAIIYPKKITEEMMEYAQTPFLWHYASNLNAMLEFGYCSKCHLCPNGCWCNEKSHETL